MALSDTIPMKSTHMHVEGNDTLISGTAQVNRDLATEQNWWKLRPKRSIADDFLPPLPVDTEGQPMRLCSNGHYDALKNFSRAVGRKDGLDQYCKSCRKAQLRRWRETQAEQAGRVLRAQAGRPPKAATA